MLEKKDVLEKGCVRERGFLERKDGLEKRCVRKEGSVRERVC